MHGRNSRAEKQLESLHGHVIARIRPLKGSHCKAAKNRRSLGNPKEFR